MDELVYLDLCGNLREEIRKLREELMALLGERDDLRYHVCPELEARYAREIGDYENQANYLLLKVRELKRKIEIVRAAINREKTVSREKMDGQVHREYQRFHQKVDEEYRRSRQAQWEQRERERKQWEYERQWQEQYGTGTAGMGGSREGGPQAGEGPGQDPQRGDGTSGNTGTGEGADGDIRKRIGTDNHSDGGGNVGGSSEKGADASGSQGKKPDIKELYRKIVKKLHPDMNPNATEREKELFNQAVQAYQDGNIVKLQEIYDEVFGGGVAEADLKNVSYQDLLKMRDELRAKVGNLKVQLDQVKKMFPYNMKEFLDQPEEVKKKQEELQETIRQEEETIGKLTRILQEEIGKMNASAR